MAPVIGSLLVLLLGLSVSAAAGEEETGYSPYARRTYSDKLFWGDTHVHTNLSADAYGMGDRLTPADAYAFARGATVTSNTGQPVRLSRPLDFIAITDHAEYLGVSAMLDQHADRLVDSQLGQRWLSLARTGDGRQILMDAHQADMGKLNLPHDAAVSASVWRQVAEAADRHNDPGVFTAFIGYEWSALPDGNNLHRNVLFRDGGDRVGETLPFSALDSRDPEDLWRHLEQYEKRTGGQAIAIPHNANMSNGVMFGPRTLGGAPLTTVYAQTRARWEPVVEVTQMKGDGETHPYLSPEDEFADFETWDQGNFALPRVEKQQSMLQFEYARSALENGLQLQKSLGFNPFNFGMIGSSDTHIALSAVEENNYFGKFAVDEPSAERVQSRPARASKYAAAGYAAVWATENTREALFDALRRREVYATTGPRIMVRFFGGWEFRQSDDERPDYAAIAYRKGVPMGGDLGPATEGGSPTFLVVAAKDPLGANLDRVQIVKGWLGDDGEPHEKVFDVALSDNRKVDPGTGRVPPLKSTVDVASATYLNSTGEAQLSAVWEDPGFSTDSPAFYYVRVLEIPTPRWTTYDAAYYGSLPSGDVPAEIQERAYSSPIWYNP